MYIKGEHIDLNGHCLVLRNAAEADAEILLEYLKTVYKESRFLTKEPQEITVTLKQEQEFIKNLNASGENLMLLGFLDGECVGSGSLMGMGTGRMRHRVTLAIALYQKYTGMGIGKIMMEKLISAAREIGAEQIELEVMTENKPAIALYQKMGFEICGTLPRNMKYKDGTYADAYWMMKRL